MLLEKSLSEFYVLPFEHESWLLNVEGFFEGKNAGDENLREALELIAAWKLTAAPDLGSPRTVMGKCQT